MIKDRHSLIDFLGRIEKDFPVYGWQIAGADIWPLLKMQLFFGFYKQHLNKQKKGMAYFANKVTNRVKLEYSKIKNIKSGRKQEITLESKDILFLAPYNSRVFYENNNISRFFDPLMDSVDYSSYLLEYNFTDVSKFYKKERVINAGAFYASFKRKYVNQNFDFDSLYRFKEFLISVEKEGISDVDSVLKNMEQAINEIMVWGKVWNFFILKTSPKLAVVNCYYNIPMFGFLIAAKGRNLPIIDMQHGGFGPSHPLYSFCNFDNYRYSNLLPDYFWVWDESSKTHLETFLIPERIINGGNTWIQYYSSKRQKKTLSGKKIILYTLQDGDYFPDKIVHAIKEKKDEYQWWIRMHPRTPKLEVDRVHRELVKNKIEKLVEIKKANILPLPEILSNTHIHVSSFSGSIIEAAVLNVPYNITISEVGKKNYQNLIASKQLHHLDMEGDDDFFSFIDKLTVNEKLSNDINYNGSYNDIIRKIIKK